ncbi:hypothetical protein GCM10025881_02740 [Pseudolysinimonas kribbensis]|uniref:Amino acid permease/ SLC12A domain-containing protein n=1 Tax=Pseudolysinimonas kribbensis TaxID=433641 RepID=A0ABQ6JYQ7_9MICO|nr:amino acid permease [Pseudolysinimonas kribbensis]GMA93450.1 hypothetical protein GCM10025881_02740 [Pseudolysinimonas kribbensis]
MTATVPAGETLAPRKKLGLLGVMLPGLAQIAPAFNLFFTTGVIASLAGASVPLVFLISTVGFLATGLSLAQFSSVYPSSGSFVTYISRTFGAAVGTATGVITVLGYIITFSGIYIFVGDYIVTNVFGVTGPHVGLTIITTIVYGAIVVIPVILGLQFGVRVTIVLYLIEIVVLLVISLSVLFQGARTGSAARRSPGRPARRRRTSSCRSASRWSPSAASRRPPRSPRRPPIRAGTCPSRSSARCSSAG